MRSQENGTAAARKMQLQEAKAMARTSFEGRITTLLGDIYGDFEKTAEGFRRIHQEMMERKQKMWTLDQMMREWAENMRGVSGGGIDAYIAEALAGFDRDERVTGDDCEKFVKVYEEIRREKDPFRRMLKAAKSVKKLNDMVPGWKSKYQKILQMAGRSDGNANENGNCERMKLMVDKKLEVIAERRKSMMMVFSSAKGAVERKIAELADIMAEEV